MSESTPVDLRAAWNYLYAQRISERAGLTQAEALKVADGADDAYNDNEEPGEAADEELSNWTD
ncbi:MAG: hypothetical protein Q7U28_09170 [Aquabacterium sp.]|nr:hypothetical protein [Aquabacterium sp.]